MSTPSKVDSAAAATPIPRTSKPEDSLENLESALVDLTEDMLPGYAILIQNTAPLELEPIMLNLVTEALTKPLKDKALTKMLGNLAIVVTARLKYLSQLQEGATFFQHHKERDESHDLLKRAMEEIDDVKAKNQTYADHLQDDQKQIQRLQEHLHEAELRAKASRDVLPLFSPLVSNPFDTDLDKIARNLPRFEPTPGGSQNISSYLKDIDFYLRKFPNATADDRIYLIKVTSGCQVGRFLERQTDYVRSNYDLLYQALIREFSDPISQTGLTAAMTTKQGRHESPHQYYHRLLLAYFGNRNEPGMEEDLNFKTLFVQNLHPGTSCHLGVMANPYTSTIQQLRELATLGFAKQKQSHSKQSEPNIVLTLNANAPPMELEGAPSGEIQGPANRSSRSHRFTEEHKRYLPPHNYHESSRPPWSGKGQNQQRYEPRRNSVDHRRMWRP
uniref:Uncharacterized protein n=1 Tax=Seriola dumerili TaxID=41447 RepID=A0A3B4VL06_SERDU